MSLSMRGSSSGFCHSSIFILSDYEFCAIISWLDVGSICCFDSAVGNFNDRILWLTYLSAADLAVFDVVDHCYQSVRWLISRGVRVTSILTPLCEDPGRRLITDYTFIGPNIPPIESQQVCGFNHDTLANILMGATTMSMRRQNILLRLRLRDCSCISDMGIAFVAHYCSTLTSIELNKCAMLTDVSIASIAKCCHQLTSLSLHRFDNFTDAGLIEIAKGCPDLTSIDFYSNNYITSTGIAAIALSCVSLESICFYDCSNIDDDAISVIAKHCPALSTVKLGCAGITTTSLIALGSVSCSQLQHLELHCQGVITDVGFLAIARGCPLLTSFIIKNEEISDFGLKGIAKGCPSLTTVSFRSSERISDDGIFLLAELCPNITSFQCQICSITYIGITEIALKCHNLTSLNLAENMINYSNFFDTLSRNCPLLKYLVLSENRGLTDRSLSYIGYRSHYGGGFPALVSIEINSCWQITDNGVTSIVKGCPNLTSMDLSDCFHISDFSLLAIIQHLPLLTGICLDATSVSDIGQSALEKAYPLLIVYGNGQ